MSKYATECKVCSKAKSEARYDEASAHVARGTCPHCGTKLVRNLSLTGWWQCGAYGAVGFKGDKTATHDCSFQCFTRGELLAERRKRWKT